MLVNYSIDLIIVIEEKNRTLPHQMCVCVCVKIYNHIYYKQYPNFINVKM